MGRGDKQPPGNNILSLRSRPAVHDRLRISRERKVDDTTIFETGYSLNGVFVRHSFNDEPARRIETLYPPSAQEVWCSDGQVSRDPSLGPACIEQFFPEGGDKHGLHEFIEDYVVDGKRVLVNGFSTTNTSKFRSFSEQDITQIEKYAYQGAVKLTVNDIEEEFEWNSIDDAPTYIRTFEGLPVSDFDAVDRPAMKWHVDGKVGRANGPAEVYFEYENGMPSELHWMKDGEYEFDVSSPSMVLLYEDASLKLNDFLDSDHGTVATILFQRDGTFKPNVKGVHRKQYVDPAVFSSEARISPEEARELRDLFVRCLQ